MCRFKTFDLLFVLFDIMQGTMAFIYMCRVFVRSTIGPSTLVRITLIIDNIRYQKPTASPYLELFSSRGPSFYWKF